MGLFKKRVVFSSNEYQARLIVETLRRPLSAILPYSFKVYYQPHKGSNWYEIDVAEDTDTGYSFTDFLPLAYDSLNAMAYLRKHGVIKDTYKPN